jgi:hypothetical protein
LYLLFLTFIILGVILLFTIVLFSRHKGSKKSIYNLRQADWAYGSDNSIPQQGYKGGSTGGERDSYLPVIHTKKKIPGLNRHDLVHYLGHGALFNVDTLSDPREIFPERLELKSGLEGALAVTTKYILIFNEKERKKILIDSIGKFAFSNSYLIIQRKKVKKKKDILRVFEKEEEFKYILDTLI